MKPRLAPLALAGALLAGCGGGSPSTTGTAPHAASATLRAYFFRGPGLVPVAVTVPRTAAVGTAALGALLAGPPPGYWTALPAGIRLEKLTVSGGVATASFSAGIERLPRTAQGQIVYTLTQFPSVRGVEALSGTRRIALEDGAERRLARPATRLDFVDLTPDALIYVEEPRRDSTVTSPVRARGTADTFEGSFAAEAYVDGKLVAGRAIQASAGSGTRGTWRATFDLPPGEGTLVFYEPSAENGARLHTTVVHVRVVG